MRDPRRLSGRETAARSSPTRWSRCCGRSSTRSRCGSSSSTASGASASTSSRPRCRRSSRTRRRSRLRRRDRLDLRDRRRRLHRPLAACRARRGQGAGGARARRGRRARSAESTAYSDSHTDVPFLEAVGHPVASTRPALRRSASAAGRARVPERLVRVAPAHGVLARRARAVALVAGLWGAVRRRAPEEARPRLAALGFGPDDVETLAEHFLEAERRGQARPRALADRVARDAGETLDLDARAAARRLGAGLRALGRRRRARLPDARRGRATRSSPSRPSARARRRLRAHVPDRRARLLGARCSPTAASSRVLTATSPRRLAPPGGGAPLAGTNPLAIADSVVATASRSSPTSRWARSPTATCSPGARAPEELVPFGGEQAHKAFALAVGLQLLVDALTPEDEFGAVLRRRAAGGGSGAGAARRSRDGARACPATVARRAGKPGSPRIASKSVSVARARRPAAARARPPAADAAARRGAARRGSPCRRGCRAAPVLGPLGERLLVDARSRRPSAPRARRARRRTSPPRRRPRAAAPGLPPTASTTVSGLRARPRLALERRVADEDERRRRPARLVAVDGEARAPAQHEVDLLVPELVLACAPRRSARRPRAAVYALMPNAAMPKRRRTGRQTKPSAHRDPVELVDVRDGRAGLAHRPRSSASTTGSICADAVDALLEVLGAGPGGERLLQLAV